MFAARSLHRQALRAVLHHQARGRRRAGLRRHQADEVRGVLRPTVSRAGGAARFAAPQVADGFDPVETAVCLEAISRGPVVAAVIDPQQPPRACASGLPGRKVMRFYKLQKYNIPQNTSLFPWVMRSPASNSGGSWLIITSLEILSGERSCVVH